MSNQVWRWRRRNKQMRQHIRGRRDWSAAKRKAYVQVYSPSTRRPPNRKRTIEWLERRLGLGPF